jgi:hypothetical protein
MLPHWQKQLENVELKKNDMFWQEYQFSNSVTKRINAFAVLARGLWSGAAGTVGACGL